MEHASWQAICRAGQRANAAKQSGHLAPRDEREVWLADKTMNEGAIRLRTFDRRKLTQRRKAAKITRALGTFAALRETLWVFVNG